MVYTCSDLRSCLYTAQQLFVCLQPTSLRKLLWQGSGPRFAMCLKALSCTFPTYGLVGKILHKLCDKKTIKWKNLPLAKIWKSGWCSVDSTPMFKFSNSYLREHLSTLALNAWAITLPRGGGVGRIFICFAGSGPWPGVGGYLILLKTRPFL